MDQQTQPPHPEVASSTIIAHDVVIRGDIEGPTNLQVQGRVTGAITVSGLVVDAQAVVEGPLKADTVSISGRVTGSVEADAVEVTKSARVDGDVTYVSLQIEKGARVSGRLIFAEAGEANIVRLPEAAARREDEGLELASAGQEFTKLAERLKRV